MQPWTPPVIVIRWEAAYTRSRGVVCRWNRSLKRRPLHVMAGLVPAIHAFACSNNGSKTWMPATSAGMTGEMLQPLGEETQQARRDEAGMAAGLVNRIAEPVVRGAVHHAGTHLEFRLLERLQEFERLRLVIDYVVLGAPDQEHRGLVVAVRRVADRRGVERSEERRVGKEGRYGVRRCTGQTRV